MTLLIATNNTNKAREIRALFACGGGENQPVANCDQMKIMSLAEWGLAFTPGEDGGTFEANATQKAVETMVFLRENVGQSDAFIDADGFDRSITPDALYVLADDSGLVIDSLDGAPGVDSALYLGVDTPFAVRNAHILDLMKDVPDGERTARFVCVAACCLPDGSVVMCRGVLEGIIAREMMGSDGFGYDPIFYVPGYGKTLAQLTVAEKNVISHRGLAMRGMAELLERGAK